MTFAAEHAAVQYAFLLGHPYDQPAWRCFPLACRGHLERDQDGAYSLTDFVAKLPERGLSGCVIFMLVDVFPKLA